MSLNLRLRHRLAENRRTVGCWVLFPEPSVALAVATADWDALVFEHEHTFCSPEILKRQIDALETCDATKIVRVPDCDPKYIAAVIRAGADGVIVPTLESPEQADIARAAIRAAVTEQYGPSSETGVLIGIIESRKGVENLDRILQTPDLDALYVGPADLGADMGTFGPWHAPENTELLATIAAAEQTIIASPVALAGICRTAAAAEALYERGCNFVTPGIDLWLLLDAAQSALSTAKSA